jgi:hypothetical protein
MTFWKGTVSNKPVRTGEDWVNVRACHNHGVTEAHLTTAGYRASVAERSVKCLGR